MSPRGKKADEKEPCVQGGVGGWCSRKAHGCGDGFESRVLGALVGEGCKGQKWVQARF